MKSLNRAVILLALFCLSAACAPQIITSVGTPPSSTATLNPPTPTAQPSPSSTLTFPPMASTVILARGDLARSGVFEFPAIRQLPRISWQAEFGDLFMGTPLVADKILYSGGSDGLLYAIDAETGDVRWSVGGFGVLETATAIAGGIIVAGGGNQRVFALDRWDGHRLWAFQTTAPVFTAPLIVGDTLFIITYDKLHVLDLQTGKVIWEINIGAEMTYISPPAFVDDTLFVAVGPKLYAFDVTTTQVRWTVNEKQPFWGLALSQSLVVVGNSDGDLHAYDQRTGEERWAFASRFGGPDEIWSSPAANGHIIYAGSRDRYVYAVDSETGQKLWEFKTNGDAVSDPVVSDGVLYVSDSNHYLPMGRRHLFALDAETGQLLWTYEITSTLLTTPALGSGVIYVTIAGAIIALQ